ncbi:MAG TPA: hypothetical protein VNX68_15325 [Nitrosopumilaceae archaeon]|jgi:hypothetical protein|nr:hypothetical protein [Nitrosopumilaceae archaeon]
MKFTPCTEEELQRRKLAPEGEYNFLVKVAEDAKSPKGFEYIKLRMQIWQGNSQDMRVIFDNLFSDEKIKHFCDSVGLEAVYKSGELQAINCENAQGRLMLKVKEDSYGLKNEVKDYIVGNGDINNPEHDKLDDEIPF